ncbi:MAG TPA: endonuclease/exonuclease/phosphatase family protein [Bryobacteraceae bacterium]|jgi:endonuclease/exonuclease/phosphatase family metal-dependent hydrolase|nr:endonuclease/exonuclease/phosphatase family protein [Bryobacteraceae bacterium]
MHRFRIATYNIHKCRGVDGRVHPERVARVLEEVNADIVSLQEVVSHEGAAAVKDRARDGADHQADYLAGRLGLFGAMGEARKHRGGAYGNVTLSRWDFKLVRPIDITIGTREQRIALRTDIRLGGHILHVFNVHLGTAVRERRQQAIRLVDRDLLRSIDISGPRIVLGDFNEWVRGLVTKTLVAEFHLTDLRAHLPRARSYPALAPFLHLDHIYFDHHLRIERAFFHRSRRSLFASDHLPLVADFVLTE